MKVKSIRELKDGLRFVTVEQTICRYMGVFKGFVEQKFDRDFIEISEGIFRDVDDGELMEGQAFKKLEAAIWKYEYDKGQES